MSHKHKEKLPVLIVGALGIVFGDIGTSPLYALKVCFSGQGAVSPTTANVLGLISLIFWSLTLVVSFKYALFIMKADDGGEGGIFAMLALLHKDLGNKLNRGLVFIGLFGSALLYGDGLITPVISVLSALEGLEVATATAKPVILPLTCLVLFILFWAQSHGTGRIGKFFGPFMILWFVVIALLGLRAIADNPQILSAVNPRYAMDFFLQNRLVGFLLLGAVVLCITGCEALYADMGHFGIKPIRFSWYFVALPALLCNYFGQGALILSDPQTATDPFYRLVPPFLLYPMVALATGATIIASQAIISGVFSLTRQAIQLGFLPRLRTLHTSAMAEGQIYVPDVNIFMLLAAVLLTFYFKASENLAEAYGIAVTGDMFITSVVFFFITRKIWRWPLWKALPLCLIFWSLDILFFSACWGKIARGGWFPLAMALGIMTVMVTWWDGWKGLAVKVMAITISKEKFIEKVRLEKPMRLPGTGVFLSTFYKEVPPMLVSYLTRTRALPEKLIILSLLTSDVPEVSDSERIEMTGLGQGIIQIIGHVGFMESPDVLQILALARRKGLDIDLDKITYYIGRITLVPSSRKSLHRWRRFLFAFMQRNSGSRSTYFGIPPNKVLEIGIQMEF
jgi:KUP system potassium uptake protein